MEREGRNGARQLVWTLVWVKGAIDVWFRTAKDRSCCMLEEGGKGFDRGGEFEFESRAVGWC